MTTSTEMEFSQVSERKVMRGTGMFSAYVRSSAGVQYARWLLDASVIPVRMASFSRADQDLIEISQLS
jgi:hypothetical protein